jgi:hypothetical protein
MRKSIVPKFIRLSALPTLLLLPNSAVAGVFRQICENEAKDVKICLQDPNPSGDIGLKVNHEYHKLEELQPFERYADVDKLFFLDLAKLELEDRKAGLIYSMKCEVWKPGQCSRFF